MHRHEFKKSPVIDSEGREWTIQLDKGIKPGLVKASTIVWINQTTRQQVLGHAALAEETAGCIDTIKIYGAKIRSYHSSSGKEWVPTNIELST